MKEAFRTKRFNAEQATIIDHLNDIIGRFNRQGVPRSTLRSVYYQFIAHDLFPDTWIDPVYNQKQGLAPDTKNTVKNYKKLGDIVSDARLAGLVDWEAIVDLERKVMHPQEFTGLDNFVRRLLPAYRLPRWEGQDNYVEVWVEKNGMTVSIEDVTDEYHVPLVANKGYGSMTNLYEGSKRFIDAGDEGKDCHILYLGDHDPSGLDMDNDIAKRMEMFGATVSVHRIALTSRQVEEYQPPPNPAKLTDSRAKDYIEKFGTESWEVNALDPSVINDFIKERLDQLIDRDLMDAVIEEEEADKVLLEKAVEQVRKNKRKKNRSEDED